MILALLYAKNNYPFVSHFRKKFKNIELNQRGSIDHFMSLFSGQNKKKKQLNNETKERLTNKVFKLSRPQKF